MKTIKNIRDIENIKISVTTVIIETTEVIKGLKLTEELEGLKQP